MYITPNPTSERLAFSWRLLSARGDILITGWSSASRKRSVHDSYLLQMADYGAGTRGVEICQQDPFPYSADIHVIYQDLRRLHIWRRDDICPDWASRISKLCAARSSLRNVDTSTWPTFPIQARDRALAEIHDAYTVLTGHLNVKPEREPIVYKDINALLE